MMGVCNISILHTGDLNQVDMTADSLFIFNMHNLRLFAQLASSVLLVFISQLI